MKNSTNTITVSILGASGYSGAMALRLLLRHPQVNIGSVFASQMAGQPVHAVYPSLRGLTDKVFEEYAKEKVENADLVVIALPPGYAMHVASELIPAGKKVIDLSGDFRLKDTGLYQEYYGAEHHATPLVSEAMYGLPEINREAIAKTSLLSNPGCYPTSAIIPLAPLVKNNLIEEDDISISSLSGVSGAGRKASIDLSFAEIDGSVKAYKVGTHQHIPEIQSVLSEHAKKEVTVNFVPHLLPTVRGIYTTTFVTPKQHVRESMIADIYESAFASEPFVRYLENEVPELKSVVGSNFIDFGWKLDKRTGKLILFSAIDNLVKGAAGQAVQNMNIMYGFDEKEGLL
jgi:N-acetyl-gamma-glutamyl-phosphate reductase